MRSSPMTRPHQACLEFSDETLGRQDALLALARPLFTQGLRTQQYQRDMCGAFTAEVRRGTGPEPALQREALHAERPA